MGSLSTVLFNAAGSLRVFEQAMAVTQNNVSNANTPGFAKQVQALEAQPFDIQGGLSGGVSAGPVVSTRDTYAEAAVRNEQSSTSLSKQTVADLETLQPQFDLTGNSGISGALNNLFDSFSQLSVNPNDAVYRQNVLNQAQSTAQAFQQTATAILNTGSTVNSETSGRW